MCLTGQISNQGREVTNSLSVYCRNGKTFQINGPFVLLDKWPSVLSFVGFFTVGTEIHRERQMIGRVGEAQRQSSFICFILWKWNTELLFKLKLNLGSVVSILEFLSISYHITDILFGLEMIVWINRYGSCLISCKTRNLNILYRSDT